MKRPLKLLCRVGRRYGITQYYEVLLFADRAGLHRHLAKLSSTKRYPKPRGYWKNTEGVALSWGGLRRHVRRQRIIGQVLLHRKLIGGGIVAHEMTHAGLYWVMSGRPEGEFPVKFTKEMDEQLATCVGAMCRQFWNWYLPKVSKKVHLV